MKISIDIGTSYSSMCVLNRNGEAEPVECSTGISTVYGSKTSLPSAVYVDDSGNVLLGQAAINNRSKKPQNFRNEFKRCLGQNIPIVLGIKEFMPEDLYTEMFRHMKRCAEQSRNEAVNMAYITYPASFGEMKRDKIRKAAERAGLFDTVMIDEPTAAAMSYIKRGKLRTGDVILVYDFGGGTFDVSLMKYENGKCAALAHSMGLEHCGGIDIDRIIYEDLLSKIYGDIQSKIDTDKVFKAQLDVRLAEEAVKIKHALTYETNVQEMIPIGFDIMEYTLGRGELNAKIAAMVQNTIDCCSNIIKNAGIDKSKVNVVLLVGGTSRVPLVREQVQKFAGKAEVYSDIDPELAIAEGAFWGAAVKKENTEKLSVELGDAGRKQQAENENAEELVIEGRLHYSEERYEKAVECFCKAAEKGNADAQYDLGICYKTGRGVSRDYSEAEKWFRRAAEQGDADAKTALREIDFYKL